eukprot:1045158_1
MVTCSSLSVSVASGIFKLVNASISVTTNVDCPALNRRSPSYGKCTVNVTRTPLYTPVTKSPHVDVSTGLVGFGVGVLVGVGVGRLLGFSVGFGVGRLVGFGVGCGVGRFVGFGVGFLVGLGQVSE